MKVQELNKWKQFTHKVLVVQCVVLGWLHGFKRYTVFQIIFKKKKKKFCFEF